MKAFVEVRVDGDSEPQTVKSGTPAGDVLPAVFGGRPVLAAVLENIVVSLDAPLMCDASVSPLTIDSPSGAAVYRDTLCFLLAKAAAETYPGRTFRVHSSLGSALWCTLEPFSGEPEKEAADLAARVRSFVAAGMKISCTVESYRDAVAIFREQGSEDELNILAHRNPPAVLLHECGGFHALRQTALARSAALTPLFALDAFRGGFVLRVPDASSPDSIPPLPGSDRWLSIYAENSAKARMMDVETVGDLNRVIAEDRFADYVRTVESFQTKNLAKIADGIAARSPAVRLILLAGPSSSGKTTVANRLCTQLRVNGLRPMLVSTDDYFVGDARNPRDDSGNLDYETVEAVDRDRLAADLNALFAGSSVHMRKFDFEKHEGFDERRSRSLPPGGVVVLEGIHALNPVLTGGVDDSVKFRIFMNAFTQLVVDSCNRISARDTRLLRRLVRDSRYRGQSALDTLRMWPSVYDGEKKWIYPYQDLADAVFNSALDYELAVLKPFATRLLDTVKPWDPEFVTARALSGLLHNVSPAPPDAVPGDSILRESIGGSQLSY